ncbi:MAG: hypothetical protein N2515_10225, partial [Deltaproteobacteria bacterium]|nr:hypothetical protein [Deltaproteobacteria bacterium]
ALLQFLRRYNPNYRRSRLAALMKQLFQEDIERELRLLESYVLDLSNAHGNYGKNLLEPVLSKDAPFSRFKARPDLSLDRQSVASLPTLRFDIGKFSSAQKTSPEADSIHSKPTVIFDASSLEPSKSD